MDGREGLCVSFCFTAFPCPVLIEEEASLAAVVVAQYTLLPTTQARYNYVQQLNAIIYIFFNFIYVRTCDKGRGFVCLLWLNSP